MKQKILLVIALSIPVFSFAEAANNTWYAGSTHIGTVTTQGLKWNCSGGTCLLRGPYGTGLNMSVCHELSQKVGGLNYYYNDSGMVWSDTENSVLLDQCNGNKQ